MDAEQFQRISKALAEPTRLEILERIATVTDEMACASLRLEFPISQATLSHHLKELANAGLIRSRWESKFCFYELERKTWAEYLAELSRRIPARAPRA